MTSLLVIGGSGFLGQQICRIAVSRGMNVTSLSPHGMPNFGNKQPLWATEVRWTTGDVFEPLSYTNQLIDATTVVHTVGILLEADYYKRFMSIKESPLATISRIGIHCLGIDRNPLASESEKPKTRQYEYMNKKAAITVAEAASKLPNIHTFIMISAAGSFPGIPERYITTKREAEEYIANIKSFRSVFMRPGFMYSPSRPISVPLSMIMGAISGLTGGKAPFIGAAGIKPLLVDHVAAATIEAALTSTVSGAVEVSGIENLASRLT
ncbi:hypothetical protein NEOLI_000518 [Neolecta irregularis DAH-3]|uniref:NAD(P)-binding domain-containing protein n=1 Tax=Neolecta irregularis (strain DAH-3) TaxID=1198029 RepID=A0A1U7LSA3_NEOID|nr:hypothetical protein NEOLI_000518 [Neolecta irregularis DAH-3]|eukprot:OLL25422.1 hypothetical protein NEOLI_000518 [Neolecta irregularis DAH-3]